jgi:hypothetical protein
MKRITLLLVAVVILAGIIALTAPASLHADDSAAPIFVANIPPGYRDWRLISVSHEAGNVPSAASWNSSRSRKRDIKVEGQGTRCD